MEDGKENPNQSIKKTKSVMQDINKKPNDFITVMNVENIGGSVAAQINIDDLVINYN